MTAFTALLGASFKKLLLTTANIGSRKKKKAASGLFAFIFIGVLMLFISGVYSFALAAAFAELGGLDVMLLGIGLLALVFPFMFTAFSAQGLVFSPADMDLVFSLPVSSFSVMLSRVLALYLEVLFLTELLLLPAGIAYAAFGGSAGAIAGLLLGGVFLALLPATLGLVFACLISLLVAKLKYKNLFTTLFSLVLLVGIFMGSMAISGAEQNAAAITDLEPVRAALRSVFPPVTWLVQGATGHPLYLLGLAAVCVLPFLGVVWVFSKFYKRLLTSLSGHKLERNYKLRSIKATGSFGALLKKEASRFFGTPMYLINHGIGIVLVLIAGVWLLLQRGTLLDAVAEMGLPPGFLNGLGAPIVTIFCLLVGVMSCPSSVSISLEGKNLWLLKAAPVSPMRVFLAKAGFNFVLVAGGVLLCNILFSIAFSATLGAALAALLIGWLFGAFVGVSGVFINLLLPRMEWDNSTQIIKQSASFVVAILLDFIVVGLVVGLYALLFMAGFSFTVFAVAACLLLLALTALCYALLRTKGQRVYSML